MLADEFVEFLACRAFLDERNLHLIHIAEIIECVFTVPDVSQTSTHTGGEIATYLSKYHYTTAGHILAAMVACTFYHGCGSRVAYTEALAHTTVHIQFATGCAV